MTETTFAQKLDTFQESYHTLISIAEQYSARLQTLAGVCGDWSAREVLAHINGWLVETQHRYPRYARGTGKMDYHVDAFNAVSVWLREDKDFEQILDETRTLFAKMLTIANELPEAYLERDSRYGEWLTDLNEQATTHSTQLREFLEANA